MRKLLLVPAVLIVLLALVFLLASSPPVLGYVKQKIEDVLHHDLGLPLTIGHLSGNLLFSLRAGDIDAPGLGRIEELKISYNPFGLLRRRADIRQLHVRALELDVDRLIEFLSGRPVEPRAVKTEAPAFEIVIHEILITDSRLAKRAGQTAISAALNARGRMAGEMLTIDTLCLRTERSVASARGQVPLNARDSLDISHDLRLALADLGWPEIRGMVQSSGTVTGQYSRAMIAAGVLVDAWFEENHVAGSIDLAWRLPRPDSLSVRADLRVRAAPPANANDAYDLWNVRVDLRQATLSGEIASPYGRARLSGILGGSLARPFFDGRASGKFEHAGFNPSFESGIHYENNVLVLDRLKITSPRLVADLGLRLDLKTMEIQDGKAGVSISDLSVVNCFVREPGDISGQLRFNMDIRGAIKNPRAEAELRLSDVTLYGEHITTAEFSISMVRGLVRVDHGMIESDRGRLDLLGHYDPRGRQFMATLAAEQIAFRSPGIFGTDTVRVGGDVSLDMVFSGKVTNPQGAGTVTMRHVVYDIFEVGNLQIDFSLADTTLAISLANEQRNLLIEAEISLQGDLPFRGTLKTDNLALDNYLMPATGYLTVDLSARGDLRKPAALSAALRVHALGIGVEGRAIENRGLIAATLEQGMITIASCTLAVAGQELSVHGMVPLDHQDRAMDLHAATGLIELSDIAGLFPPGLGLSGLLQCDVRIQGMVRDLDIDGRLSLNNTRYEDDHVLLDSVNCNLNFRNSAIEIGNLSGRVNGGWFDARGFADLAHGKLDTLFLGIGLKKAGYANDDFGRVVLSGDLQATGRQDSLRVSGEVVVEEAVYDVPMRLQTIIGLLTAANRPEPEQAEILRRVYCDVGISAPGSIRIMNNVADLGASADLQLKGYLARLNVYGTISAAGPGRINYLGRKFQIVNAVIQFDDPYRVNPVIDLAAVTSVTAVDGTFDIYLVLNGTATAWQLGLSSNPPLAEQDIVSLLLIGRRRPGDTGGLAGALDLKGQARDYALDALRHELERSTQDLLGLDKLTITGDLSDPVTMRIGVEKSFVKGFTLIYNTGIESWELYQIGANYDLTDRISISTLHDQENFNTSVDLNFRVEIQ